MSLANMLLALSCLLPALAGCRATTPPATIKGLLSAAQLAPTEVREYRGARLDSILDFRENSIKGPQYLDRRTYRLRVAGLVDHPASYTTTHVAAGFRSYTKAVTLHCVEGWSVSILWEGVMVRDLLDASGVRPGANTVVLRARDGYSTSFPLRYFYDNDRIMAFRMNGQVLAPERGYPFMLVAEDKWGYKWIKWIDAIEVTDDPTFRGFWEQRGYSNDGSLDKPYLGP